MQLVRQFIITLIIGMFAALGDAREAASQAYQTPQYLQQPAVTTPYQQPVARQQPAQMAPQQQPVTQTPPIRMQPLQTPPKSITHNGVIVFQQAQYQQDPNQPIQPAGQSDRTMPPGYGSPYPTGMQPVQAATPQTGTIFNLPSEPMPQRAVPQAPVATQSPQPAHTPPMAQPILTASAQTPPTGGAPIPVTPPSSAPPQNRVHMGRSAPDLRLPPIILTPEEQRELDLFLARWERVSQDIKQYQADFDMWKINPAIPGAPQGGAFKQPFGSFKFVSPDRFVYHIEGEWINGAKITRDEKKSPNVMEEKIIIDSKAIYFFDYNARKVRLLNIPPEMARKGIADSPLPLIFGAKAVDLKKRFSMKIITPENNKDSEIWLQAVPLLHEDQQEFRQITIRLDKETLRAIALKKDDINGRAYDSYSFKNVKINPWGFGNALPPTVLAWFNPTVPRGWLLEETNLVEDMNVQMQPNQPPPAQQPRQEIQLYTPQ